MISVMVLYPNVPNAFFDLRYYEQRHLPMVRARLEPAGLRAMTILTPATLDPAAPPQYRLIADLRFDDMATTKAALAAHGAETQADIPNFTNVTPVILIGPVEPR